MAACAESRRSAWELGRISAVVGSIGRMAALDSGSAGSARAWRDLGFGDGHGRLRGGQSGGRRGLRAAPRPGRKHQHGCAKKSVGLVRAQFALAQLQRGDCMHGGGWCRLLLCCAVRER